MTKIGELRELGVADLERRESELAEQLFRLRLQKSMGQQEAADRDDVAPEEMSRPRNGDARDGRLAACGPNAGVRKVA